MAWRAVYRNFPGKTRARQMNTYYPSECYKRCEKCNEIMIGIRDYAARRVCAPCGGQALRVVQPLPDHPKESA